MAAAVRKLFRSRWFRRKTRKHQVGADLSSLVAQDETSGTQATATLYEDLPGDHLRLLQIKGKIDGKLHCSLRTFPIDDAPAYRALSYTWGPAEHPNVTGEAEPSGPNNCPHTIVVNGQIVEIRQNLHDFLEEADRRDRRIHFTVDTIYIGPADNTENPDGVQHDTFESYIERPIDLDSGIYYWIDALCINQSNDEEKAEQVNRMGSIYEAAEVVMIWLGKANCSIPRVIEMLTQLAEVYEEDGKTGNTLTPFALDIMLESEQQRRLGCQRFTYDDWFKLILFFERTWFSRAWTLQEVALAPAVACYCGSYDIEWKVIYLASLTMDFTPFSLLIQFLRHELEIKPALSLSRATLVMLMRVLAFGKGDSFEFSRVFKTWYNAPDEYSSTPGLLDYCLERMSGLQCMDPRDQIFACFGIVRKAIATGGGTPLEIIPNYRKSIVDLYTETMAYILTGTGTLAPLSRVQQSAESKAAGLPSWVADMSPATCNYLLRVQKFSADEGRRPFDASRGVSKGFTISGGALTAHVYKYATVTHIGESGVEMCENNALDTARLLLARFELNPAQGLLIDDIWKTILCDVLSVRHRYYSEDDLRSGFTCYLKRMCYGLGVQLQGPNRANNILCRTKWLETLAERDDTGTIPSPKSVIASFQESDQEHA